MDDEKDNIYARIITSEEVYKKSFEEESIRYHRKPPYMNRMRRWIDKFYTPFRLGKLKDD